MKFSVEVVNVKAGLRKINALDPSTNPDILRAAFTECMTLVIDTSKKTQLSGPYPRELRQITGELAGSMQVGEPTPTGIVGGTSLLWAPVHEFGRKGLKSFMEPALDIAMAKFPEIFEKHLLRGFDAA